MVAVIVLPGVVLPVKDTEPPVGIEAGAGVVVVVVVAVITHPAWLPNGRHSPAKLHPVNE